MYILFYFHFLHIYIGWFFNVYHRYPSPTSAHILYLLYIVLTAFSILFIFLTHTPMLQSPTASRYCSVVALLLYSYILFMYIRMNSPNHSHFTAMCQPAHSVYSLYFLSRDNVYFLGNNFYNTRGHKNIGYVFYYMFFFK